VYRLLLLWLGLIIYGSLAFAMRAAGDAAARRGVA
jgi:hypothetical protein